MEEFKVGAWIKDLRTNSIEQIDINWRLSESSIKVTPKYLEDYCILWELQVGEWCWFKDEKNTIGSLTQLVGIEEDGTYYGYSSYGMPDKAPCVEPFIGELPTFLKDKQ